MQLPTLLHLFTRYARNLLGCEKGKLAVQRFLFLKIPFSVCYCFCHMLHNILPLASGGDPETFGPVSLHRG